MKFISSNFNSQLNFSITEDNRVCVFGVNTPFQTFDSDQKWVYVNSGKDYFSFIHIERLPYCWGDAKNGKLGLDVEGTDPGEEQVLEMMEEKYADLSLEEDTRGELVA